MTFLLSTLLHNVSCYCPSLAAKAFFFVFVYLAGNAVYQLYLSPLSKFPGPKIAAVTLWYEIYYDLFKFGMYHAKVKEMHERYGSIVRINPFELHVSDPDFIETLYTRSALRDKHSYLTRAFGNDDTVFSTVDHFHHRIRRNALNPFFSKQRILGIQDLLWMHVSKLCARFDEYKASGRPLPTSNAFGCLTADIIIDYALGVQQNALEDPNLAPLFTQSVKTFAATSVYVKHVPWVHKLMRAIPQSWMAKLSPKFEAMLAFRYLNNDRVRAVFERKDRENASQDTKPLEPSTTPTRHTIFDDLYSSALPPHEKSLDRLSQESQLIVGAGLDTTAHAINTTLFHILANPSVLQTLKTELHAAIPDPRLPTDLTNLEALPYLTACINEGLRFSQGLSTRNARLAYSPLQYKDFVIPAHTPISMSAHFTHNDPLIFPSPTSFMPERWLAPGLTPDGRPLERFLMTFGRGSRQCVGLNLARAEMFVALAAIVGSFELVLYECDRSDVDMARDLFLPGVEKVRGGVRVLVK